MKKMLLLGVTQRSEMRRHIDIFVTENFPDVSKLDSLFYPSDQVLSSLMYRAMILHRQAHIDQNRVLRLVRFTWLFKFNPKFSIGYIMFSIGNI